MGINEGACSDTKSPVNSAECADRVKQFYIKGHRTNARQDALLLNQEIQWPGFVVNGIELGNFTLMKRADIQMKELTNIESRDYLDRFKPNVRLKTDLKPK